MSQHPVDALIRELVQTKREATVGEIKQIINRMADAPFNPGNVRVRLADRGVSYRGQTLGARAESTTYHLIKRVAIEKQWAEGSRFDDYLDDLYRAVRHPSAQLAVYASRHDYFAAIIVPTYKVLRPEQLGTKPERLFLVVYSADRGIIMTAYLISDVSAANIPKGARWLK